MAKVESDSSSSATPEVLDSGAHTPSTAATSTVGTKRQRKDGPSPSDTKVDVKEDEDMDEDEEVKPQSVASSLRPFDT